MLTAFQVERVAYLSDGGFLCRLCAVGEFDANGGAIVDGKQVFSEDLDAIDWGRDDQVIEEMTGLRPVTRYEMDEFDSQSSYEAMGDGHESCACTLGVSCDGCGGVIVEGFYDDYEHQS